MNARHAWARELSVKWRFIIRAENLVYPKAGGFESGFTRVVSHSPFPSGLDLDSSEARYTSLITARSAIKSPIDEVTIVTRKPMAHLHRV